jgi:hypothetical protein
MEGDQHLNKQIEELKTQIAAKDEELKTQLAAKDAVITAKDAVITAKDAVITAKDEELKTQIADNAAKDAQIKAMTSQLS